MLAIVGGGLVGLSLALALAPLNIPISIIEKQPHPGEDAAVRSIALSHGAMMVYRTLGLENVLTPLLAPITSVHASEQGKFAKTYIEAKEQGLAALGYVVNVAALREVLWQALANYKHIQLLAPQQVTELRAQDDGWLLHLQDGVSLFANLVVVADGADSGIAKLLDIKTQTTAYTQCALVANVTTTVAPAGTAYERFTNVGPVALLPQSNGTMALVWAMPSLQRERWQHASEADLIKHLQPLIPGQVGRILTLSATMTYPLALRKIDTPTLSHLLFLGNAARTMHPIAAQGFNLAMRDIAHLVEMMATLTDKDMLGQLSWLQAYWQTREKDEKRTLTFTDNLIRGFQADYFPLTWLRLMGMQTLQLSPTLKRWFGLYTTGNFGHLPKLMRGVTPWSN
jgi:2-octaprenyl-6-methoxyphenol hydroxylase